MWLPFLVEGGGMVFDRSAEVRPGAEEDCGSGVMFYEELDDCWQNEDSWGKLMTESFNWRVTSITSDEKSMVF